MFHSLKAKLLSNSFLRNLHEMRFWPIRLVYKPEDLHEVYYAKANASGDQELEHQIGRLTNFKKIVGEIAERNFPGDVVEFGTWQGFSLHWIAYLFERVGIFNKTIVGIDGFIGLPESEGPFRKLQFRNTSLDMCRRRIYASSDLYDITKKHIFIEKFLFQEKREIIARLYELGMQKLVFVHLDADLSHSTAQILDILLSGDFLADTCYLLFDDWGCDTQLSKTVEDIFDNKFAAWAIREHSSTRLTKNFKLQKK